MLRRALRWHGGAAAMGVALAFVIAWSITSAAQKPPSSAQKAAIRPITSVDGKDLYNAYCAQCHGATGKGDGPAAAGLRTPPADLTQLAAKNGGTFNRRAVEAFINGDRPGERIELDHSTGKRIMMTANGPDEMPVWGIVFRYVWPNDPVALRSGNLAQYIGKIQAK